jgi:hypothetical protein
MPIPADILSKLNAHLTKKGPIKPCAVCGQQVQWVASTVITVTEQPDPPARFGGLLSGLFPQTFPLGQEYRYLSAAEDSPLPPQPVRLLMLTCPNCFNAIFFPLKLIEAA